MGTAGFFAVSKSSVDSEVAYEFSRCTARGTVLQHFRLGQERCGVGTTAPPSFIPSKAVSSNRAMKVTLQARKGQRALGRKQRRDRRPQRGLRRKKRSSFLV